MAILASGGNASSRVRQVGRVSAAGTDPVAGQELAVGSTVLEWIRPEWVVPQPPLPSERRVYAYARGPDRSTRLFSARDGLDKRRRFPLNSGVPCHEEAAGPTLDRCRRDAVDSLGWVE